jgi:hypothetical protein
MRWRKGRSSETERFVEKQKGGTRTERARQARSALFPSREVPHVSILEGLQFQYLKDAFERYPRGAIGIGPRFPKEDVPPEPIDEEKKRVLSHVSDAALFRGDVNAAVAIEQGPVSQKDAPACLPAESRDGFEQCGLSRSRGTEQSREGFACFEARFDRESPGGDPEIGLKGEIRHRLPPSRWTSKPKRGE